MLIHIYRGAEKSLARPTARCILFDGENISYDASLVIYRVIQEESAILWEMIVCVILSKKVHTNMGPILDGYVVMGIY